MNGKSVLMPVVGLGIALAPAPGAGAEATTAPSEEKSMREYRIGETELATIGRFKVALAKTWEETREGQKVLVAWLSVVEKGSTTGPKELELVAGEPLALGDLTFEVVEVKLASAAASGSVLLREKQK